MNTPIVQEATEGAGHAVLDKMKAERKYGYCPQTHQQGNTKGRKLSKLLTMDAEEKKDSK